MTIVVGLDEKGKPIGFSSAYGAGSSEEEQKKAIRLDSRIKKELLELYNSLKKNKKTSKKNKVEIYWEFGSVVRNIYLKSGLVHPSEKNFFWKNIKLRAPEIFLAKDRGPNRLHIEYCFRLSGWSKELALKRKWSEWVYLFDSPSINKETRFDKWDEKTIKTNNWYLSRDNTRIFAQCLNSILYNLETEDLSDEELNQCYNSALFLSKIIVEGKIKGNINSLIKQAILKNRKYVLRIIKKQITPKEYAKILIKEIKK